MSCSLESLPPVHSTAVSHSMPGGGLWSECFLSSLTSFWQSWSLLCGHCVTVINPFMFAALQFMLWHFFIALFRLKIHHVCCIYFSKNLKMMSSKPNSSLRNICYFFCSSRPYPFRGHRKHAGANPSNIWTKYFFTYLFYWRIWIWLPTWPYS